MPIFSSSNNSSDLNLPYSTNDLFFDIDSISRTDVSTTKSISYSTVGTIFSQILPTDDVEQATSKAVKEGVFGEFGELLRLLEGDQIPLSLSTVSISIFILFLSLLANLTLILGLMKSVSYFTRIPSSRNTKRKPPGYRDALIVSSPRSASILSAPTSLEKPQSSGRINQYDSTGNVDADISQNAHHGTLWKDDESFSGVWIQQY